MTPTELARSQDTVNLTMRPVYKALGWGLFLFAVGGVAYKWYKGRSTR